MIGNVMCQHISGSESPMGLAILNLLIINACFYSSHRITLTATKESAAIEADVVYIF